MLVIDNEPKNSKYVKLIKYAIKNCDAMLFMIRYDGYMRFMKQFDEICEIMKLNEEELRKEYKENGIKNIFEKIKYDIIGDIDQSYSSKDINEIKHMLANIIDCSEKNMKEYKDKRIKMNQIKECLKRDLIFERHNPEWAGSITWFDLKGNLEEDINNEFEYKGEYIYDICFYRTTDKIEKFLLEQKRLYSFLPPNLPEDICFFKNGYCWLKVVSHEKEAFILGESEEDIQFLQNIGIEFEKVKVTDEYIPYENY